MSVNRKKYREYINEINKILSSEEFYDDYVTKISEGSNEFTISQSYQTKQFDTMWINEIEDALISLDTIVRNPRKFIVVEEDIVDISLAKTISVESIRHLAQHTNMIASVSDQGDVTPNKILNTSKEESYEIYENRFIFTLLHKLEDFITKRYNLVQQAYTTADKLHVNVKSNFAIGETKMNYKLECIANMSLDEALEFNTTGLSNVERIVRMNRIIKDFLSSAFAKQMVGSAPVRPPIQQTNLIKKNPDFQKAMKLWGFIERYQDVGVTVDSISETKNMSYNLSEKYINLIYLNTLLLQSVMADTDNTAVYDESVEEQEAVKDFSPDDFPLLKVEYIETQKVFEKNPFQNNMDDEDLKKINAALDRIIRQYNINKTKEDSKARARLILLQKKAEEAAIKAAERQAELQLERLKRKREQEEQARLRAERQAEKERQRRLKQEAKIEEEMRSQLDLLEKEVKLYEEQVEYAEKRRKIAEHLMEIERAERITLKKLVNDEEAKLPSKEQIRVSMADTLKRTEAYNIEDDPLVKAYKYKMARERKLALEGVKSRLHLEMLRYQMKLVDDSIEYHQSLIDRIQIENEVKENTVPGFVKFDPNDADKPVVNTLQQDDLFAQTDDEAIESLTYAAKSTEDFYND